MLARYRFSKLLQGPLRGRVRGHVHVHNLACTDFHHGEDVKELESRRDNGQEVGGDDRLRVISNECRPALRRMVRTAATVISIRHVLSHGTRRHADAELDEELMGDALFAPGHILEAAISKMSFLSSSGTGGRPLGRDFQRQNKRNPFRCQRMSVSGFTTMRAFFQSKILVSAAIVNRVALSVRRGACSRSTKKVSCFRRKRFSAARALWERGRLRTNAMASRTMGTIFERSRKSEPFHVQNDDDPVVVPVGAKQPIPAGLSRGINAGSSFCGPQGEQKRESGCTG